ncbi:RICIN domain-containing protein [Streptomyces sp. NBC_00459]|uniref:RICIN domain-containing protein n=1 Tax=Streptomyces sp. NBC_00459 TaxID=2975749 RepID=UPI002E16BA9D
MTLGRTIGGALAAALRTVGIDVATAGPAAHRTKIRDRHGRRTPPRSGILRRFSSTLTALLLPAALIPVLVAQPAYAAGVTPEVIVTMPGDHAIENKAVDLINKATGTIKVAAYHLLDYGAGNPVRIALENAAKRGIKVQFVTGGHVDTNGNFIVEDGVTKLRNTFGATTSGSDARVCGENLQRRDGCFADVDMHAKFIAFDSTGGSSNVVLVTSQNWSQWDGGFEAANNAVVYVGWSSMQDKLRQFFTDMWSVAGTGAGSTNLNYGGQRGVTSSAGDADIQFFPTTGSDPVVNLINSVDCKNNDARGSIKIAVPTWQTSNPDRYVPAALVNAETRGCDVETVTDQDNDSTTTLRNGGAGVWIDYQASTYVHSKYILINDSSGNRQVWTGSPNMTYGSLRQADEVLLNVHQVGGLSIDQVYATYYNNFENLKWTGRPTMVADGVNHPYVGTRYVNPQSGKCLDIASGGKANGTIAQIWDCNWSLAQKFSRATHSDYSSTLVNFNSQRCLDVPGSSTQNGVGLQIWDCNNSAAQSWWINDTGNGQLEIMSKNSGLCLDVANSGTANGSRVQQYTCNRSGAQAWRQEGA